MAMIKHVRFCSLVPGAAWRGTGLASLSILALAGCASRDVGASGPAPDPAHGQGVFPTPYGPMRLGYDLVDGVKLHQGDIVLGDEVPDYVAPESAPAGVRAQAGTIAQMSRRWPDGVVYYVVDAGLPNPQRVPDGIAMWETKTNIRFVQSSTASSRIRFKAAPPGNCNSSIGRTGGEQIINLDSTCLADGVAHEIGHALGLYHEMSRASRDNDVVIGACKVNDHNFAKYSLTDGRDFGPYDFVSLMEYYGCNTCPNGQFEVARKSDGACVLGSSSLSVGDRNAIGWLYSYQSGVTSQDYDHDGRADQVVFRPSDGNWYVRKSSGGPDMVTQFGGSTDRQVPGDYDGDGKTDVAVFRPSEGNWYVRRSSGGPDMVIPFGVSCDILVPGDYDGDGKTDPAVFRTAEGNWYVRPSGGGPDIVTQFGDQYDIVVPGDYDGDGKTDRAVFRPSDGNWYVKRSGGGPDMVIPFGVATDLPLPADYDGDGKTDPAVFRAIDGNWYVHPSGGGPDIVVTWGEQGDRFLPADYDHDKKADFAVFRPSNGTWYIRFATGATNLVQFGGASDRTPGSR